ncbi:four helix bundle protein [Psychroserpens luteus]|uniref:Four helix bundle protein n=1 Tax=Psychroserpens luteus TaxID=1434066 RepID=A0ABW5ZSY9_9FLAO|nr:four helix bundle protein [Psychroserpens luteus]
MNKFKFEKLIIWQKAMDFGEEIDQITENFPAKEKFNLSSQVRRATDSIALNISEGSIGQSNLEQHKFVAYSIKSLAEVATCLFKAKRRNYITIERFDSFYLQSHSLMNMMIAFRKNLK